MPRYHTTSSLRVEHAGRLDRQSLWTRVYRLEAVDRIRDPIIVPARTGGGFSPAMANRERHHGTYLPTLWTPSLPSERPLVSNEVCNVYTVTQSVPPRERAAQSANGQLRDALPFCHLACLGVVPGMCLR